MVRRDPDRDAAETDAPALLVRLTFWLRTWGPALGCFIAAFVLLQFTGGKANAGPSYSTWPDNLQELQLVDSAGSRKVQLLRATFPAESAGGWTLSEGRIVQGNPDDGPLSPCEIHLDITNTTSHTYYVSAFDFYALDAKGQRIAIDPMRMRRMAAGLAGRWMSPGETWSGWLLFPRRDAAVTQLVFEPDRFTHIVLNATN